MSDFSDFRKILSKRMNESEDNYWIEDLWKEEIAIFTKDVSQSVLFIQQCTDDEIYWMSEIFDDLACSPVINENLIDAIRCRANSISDIDKKSDVMHEIDCAFDG